MVDLEYTVSTTIQFPDMRLQVIAAVRSLSDVQHQQARWGRVEEGVDYYDDFSLNVHILYDDCMVLPRPDDSVGVVLHAEEVPAFADLELALGPILADLGDSTDEVYTNDPRWAAVVGAAGAALAVMKRIDEGEPS